VLLTVQNHFSIYNISLELGVETTRPVVTNFYFSLYKSDHLNVYSLENNGNFLFPRGDIVVQITEGSKVNP
jgi:hypothetical protein